MCGIAGLFNLAEERPIDQRLLEAMGERLIHRGPDDQGYYRDGRVGLSFRRLSIIDLAGGNQPLTNEDGSVIVVCNGEIYNYRELRADLEAKGHRFRTQCDVETLPHLFEEYGERFVDHLNGQFAIALYHKPERRLYLVRDQFGIAPLFYAVADGRLIFGSEIKALLACPFLPKKVDPRGLDQVLSFPGLVSPVTMFEGVRSMRPGHFVVVEPGSGEPEQREYWDLVYPLATDALDRRDDAWYAEHLAERLLRSVSLRLRADVPVACYLSGGLDSSLVVAAMSRAATERVHTFSVRFDGPQAMDESPYARLVAAHCGTEHHEVVLDVATLKDALPVVLDHFDEPFGDSSAVPMWLVSREARRQFTVALSGDGADEVFAGYRKYLSEHYLSMLGPYLLRKLLVKPLTGILPTGRTGRWLELFRRMRRVLAADAPNRRDRLVRLLHMSPLDTGTTLGTKTGTFGFDRVRARLADRLPPDPDLNDALRFDQGLVLRDDMFVKVDRMSMKASLEVRSPFVDHHLVALANGLDPKRKLDGTSRKKVLIERLGHLLPPEIATRPKTGFEMPLGAWLRDDLAGWTEERLFANRTGREGWVDHGSLRRIWDLHKSGRLDCTEAVWQHIVFASWFERTYR